MKPPRSRSRNAEPAVHGGPELIKDILGRLFAARGWGRQQEQLQLEQAWAAAVGLQWAPHSRVCRLRRGILEVEVDSAVLLHELTQFHKRRLLEQLRERLPGRPVHDLRVRAGTWKRSP
jgi:predicted nucleic acid-binding Zn ribbon protein